LVIQHVAPEGPYALALALEEYGVALDVRRLFNGDTLPTQLDDYSGVVVMGGPMSVTSDDDFPTRRGELDLLARAVALGLPTLGVCLGAQLLAEATGGRVRAGEHGPEIGFGTVRLTSAASDDYLLSSLAVEQTVLHWHGDTFDLPPGAVRLCTNDLYKNQAFSCGPNAWGFQFHFEVDKEAVETFVGAFELEVIAAGLDPLAVVGDAPEALGRLVDLTDQVTTRFALLVAAFQSNNDSLS
jgi:GMP synthase-like glutamine amidotransferase